MYVEIKNILILSIKRNKFRKINIKLILYGCKLWNIEFPELAQLDISWKKNCRMILNMHPEHIIYCFTVNEHKSY